MSTNIEWTDETWNPTTGCTKVSLGCDNCYAWQLAHTRLEERYLAREPARGTSENRADPFAVRLWPERLRYPERWSKPRMIFVNSMSDLFHQDIPEGYVRQIFATMLRADHHKYQVLTKRPGRALRFWKRHGDLFLGEAIPKHIWLGTSIESQEFAYRERQLGLVPAAVRFLSCEPLIGPSVPALAGIHWVIVGGESGRGYRPMCEEWATSIRDRCVEHGVPFFFKQWGGRTPKAGGRALQGREWNEMPVEFS